MGGVEFPDLSTRILFFTRKGSVGQTSPACSTAVALAEHGKQVLLVGRDTASKLDEVLGIRSWYAGTSCIDHRS
jgi:arsenite-transporting ATPase